MSRPKKRLGQHFLSDPRILARIVEAIAPGPGETVLEIGPGPGALTERLAARASRLIVIEKDPDLAEPLRGRLSGVTVVQADALDVDWHELVGGGPFVVAGNIPYNVTSPLIDKALVPPRPHRIVFLVQREVADRIAAGPGGADYGALSVGVQAVARVERVFLVTAGAFRPKPKVDSALIRMTPFDPPPFDPAESARFRRFVVGLFGFRRKQLGRGLRELLDLGPESVARILSESAILPATRPQELSVAAFITLFRAATRAS